MSLLDTLSSATSNLMNTTQNQNKNQNRTSQSPQAAQAEKSHMEASEAVKNAIYALGQKYYDDNKDKSGSDYQDQIDEVKKCIEKKNLWYEYRLSLDGKIQCEHCLEIITSDSAFCNKCGGKIEPRDFSSISVNQHQDTTPQAKLCPSCGAPITEGAMFCEKCGASVS